MSDYNFTGTLANVAAAIQVLAASGVTDFCPAMEFNNSGNLLSTPPQDGNGTAYIRVRGNNLATPSGLTAISAVAAIPWCGVWMGENP